MAGKKTPITIGNRKLELSNLDKVFYPATGFTKGDVIDYYRNVSAALIPHLKDRPLTLKRYPNGVAEQFFYEKQCPKHRPDWLTTVRIPRQKDDKILDYCVINNQAGLVWTANLASIELHVSLARTRELVRPTAMVFDLDPGPGTDVVDCGEVALWFRDTLEELGLVSFVKTSGSKGLQVFVPLNTKVTYDDTRPFANALAKELEAADPKGVTTSMKKAERPGKIFIDWSQNNFHKTTACVYSLRAKERPTASTPVDWGEVSRAVEAGDAAKLTFEAAEVLARIERHGDLFEPVLKLRQKLPSLD